jgi:hypothetical protein
MALTQAAVYDVDHERAGIASALLNTAQQLGVALGLVVLASVAATVTAATRSSGVDPASALVAGYSAALLVATGILVSAGALGFMLLSPRTADSRAPEPAQSAV